MSGYDITQKQLCGMIADDILAINPLFFNRDMLIEVVKSLDQAMFMGANLLRLANNSMTQLILLGKLDELVELLNKCRPKYTDDSERKLEMIIEMAQCLSNFLKLQRALLDKVSI